MNRFAKMNQVAYYLARIQGVGSWDQPVGVTVRLAK